MRFRVLNRYWTLIRQRYQGNDGYCMPSSRKMYVAPDLSPEDELETTLHEYQHCVDAERGLHLPAHEDAVTKIGKDASRLLIRMGWRKQ